MVQHLPPLIHEAKRQAEKLGCYCIRPHGFHLFRLWRMYDEWKPVQEFASVEDAETYLFNKLPTIESEL